MLRPGCLILIAYRVDQWPALLVVSARPVASTLRARRRLGQGFIKLVTIGLIVIDVGGIVTTAKHVPPKILVGQAVTVLSLMAQVTERAVSHFGTTTP